MDNYKRQLGIFNPDKDQRKIFVFGAGTIGSFTTLSLCKMGLDNISVYDFDVIESHNQPNQLYRTQDIGKKKVDALAELMLELTDKVIHKFDVKIDRRTEIDFKEGDIAILAFDSLLPRLIVAKKALSKGAIVIDGRMGRLQYRVFKGDKDNKATYLEGLRPIAVAEIPCSEKSICFNGMAIASMISAMITKTIKNEFVPSEVSVCLETFQQLTY